MPKISVIVPVYKVEPYLRKCINSILSQSFCDFKLILVDDGSPDQCGEICDECATSDSRIFVIHKPNGGLSSARNAGIDKALSDKNCEWVTFIDSDDMVTPDYLESLYCAVKSTGLSVSVGGVRAIDNDGNFLFEQCEHTEQVLSPEELTVRFSSLGTWAVAKLYPIRDFENVRYPNGLLYEDRHTTHLITYRYAKLAMVNKSIYIYRYNRPGNIIGDTGKKYKNRIDRISGLKCQLDFFIANGYHRAAETVAVDLLNWLASSVKIKFGHEEKRCFERELRLCHGKYFKKYCVSPRLRRTYREALYGRCFKFFGVIERVERLTRCFSRAELRENDDKC